MTSSGPHYYARDMGAESDMSLAIAKTLVPIIAHAVLPAIDEEE